MTDEDCCGVNDVCRGTSTVWSEIAIVEKLEEAWAIHGRKIHEQIQAMFIADPDAIEKAIKEMNENVVKSKSKDFTVCLDCDVELCVALDSYYGNDVYEKARCSQCRGKKPSHNPFDLPVY